MSDVDNETLKTDDSTHLDSPESRSVLSFDDRSLENSVPTGAGGKKSPSLCSVEEEDETEVLPPPSLSCLSRYISLEQMALRVARAPKTYFWVSFLSVLALSALSMYFGEFRIVVNNVGWPSRGTLVSNRQSQIHLVNRNLGELAIPNNDCLWEDLTSHVQLGWEIYNNGQAAEARAKERGCGPFDNRRALSEERGAGFADVVATSEWQQKQRELEDDLVGDVLLPRKNLTTMVDQCHMAWYSDKELIAHERLWPTWKLKSRDPEASILDPHHMRDLCEAEENTQRLLREQGYCYGCNDGDCLPPLSPVLYARFTVRNGFIMNCQELAEAWAPHQHKTEERWKECIEYIEDVGTVKFFQDRGPCPHIFSPSFVDADFAETGKLKFTSSVFLTSIGTGEDMYRMADQFDRGTGQVEGAYDTNINRFLNTMANEVVFRDVALAACSAFASTVAMLVHTRSPFLTLVGIIQISLSFPLAYGIYRFVGGFVFFPFLNLIGLFVAFALGADHIFVAVDKWKNMRREMPKATTEEVAVKALPSAAKAMVLTTTTTAVAFFGSAICPIPSIKLFAVFCGLLIILDYIVDVLVMFPCLCIYDGYRSTPNYLFDWRSLKRNSKQGEEEESSPPKKRTPPLEGITEELIEDDATGDWRLVQAERPSKEDDQTEESSGPFAVEEEVEPNLIQRILTCYYNVLHSCRWPLLAICMAALAICCWGATTFSVPDNTSDIQFLDPRVEYERSRKWRGELLITKLYLEAGSKSHVAWGLTPADTGDKSNPLTFTSLVLDDSFDPSSEQAQVYMREFCDKFYSQEFAQGRSEEFECPILMFDEWLGEQSSIPLENQEAVYIDNCEGASGMPIPQESLHACLSSWAHQVKSEDILSWNGTVKIITLPFGARVSVNSHNKEIGSEWNLMEGWMNEELSNAPSGVSNAYFTSMDFWLWDTSFHVYRTALDSGAFAIAITAVVILITSRSISMTFFSAISVVYVLVSVTALMSTLGWTLGFLESICFTILIGLSADFVIHFTHAYSELPGNTDRHTRTKFALIHLGPSVLAAGFTTLAGATVMLFTVIYFFRIFAMVLFFAIVQATIGSFVVFLVLTDCLGPSNPTYLFDKLLLLLPPLCHFGKEDKYPKKETRAQDRQGATPNSEQRGRTKQEPKQKEKQVNQSPSRPILHSDISSSHSITSNSASEGMVVEC